MSIPAADGFRDDFARVVADGTDIRLHGKAMPIFMRRVDLGPDAFAGFERALEGWRNLEDRWNQANTLGELAAMYLARGDFYRAGISLDEAWGLVGEKIPEKV